MRFLPSCLSRGCFSLLGVLDGGYGRGGRSPCGDSVGLWREIHGQAYLGYGVSRILDGGDGWRRRGVDYGARGMRPPVGVRGV